MKAKIMFAKSFMVTDTLQYWLCLCTLSEPWLQTAGRSAGLLRLACTAEAPFTSGLLYASYGCIVALLSMKGPCPASVHTFVLFPWLAELHLASAISLVQSSGLLLCCLGPGVVIV